MISKYFGQTHICYISVCMTYQSISSDDWGGVRRRMEEGGRDFPDTQSPHLYMKAHLRVCSTSCLSLAVYPTLSYHVWKKSLPPSWSSSSLLLTFWSNTCLLHIYMYDVSKQSKDWKKSKSGHRAPFAIEQTLCSASVHYTTLLSYRQRNEPLNSPTHKMSE